MIAHRIVLLCGVLCLAACSSENASPTDGGLTADDAGDDGGSPCHWKDVPATAGAGGKVQAGALQAGAAEVMIDIPLGTALGGYTARSIPLGGVGFIDGRTSEMSGKFYPSVGIETIPKMKAVALSAGGENVVMLRADLILSNDSLTFDIADQLGPAYAGKVVFSTTHSHSSFAQYSTNSTLAVGLGRFRSENYKKLLATAVKAAQAAIAAMKPAQLGIAVETAFDPMDEVSHDRRGENDALAGGPRKDSRLYVVRVDAMDGTPIAVIDIVGVHGTVLDADNQLALTDAPGAIERAVEESFDSKVVAMHLQGAAGDVSPSGRGGVDRDPNDLAHYNFARAESVGRLALPWIRAVWTKAGMAMQSSLAMEMLTREIPLGPDYRNFSIRKGAIAYAPWDPMRACDGKVWSDTGAVLSPIDEFNAPFGAGLCGGNSGVPFQGGQMPGTEMLKPYKSCALVEVAVDYLGSILSTPFEPAPVCGSTRTTISALRLGDYVMAILPGEPLTLLADRVRALSPIAPDKTIVIGYSQGHIGYLLTAEDWLQGGYEPSINLWGPLEGEYIAERLAELLPLALTDDREDAAKGSPQRMLPFSVVDDVPGAELAPLAGTVPAPPLNGSVYLRGLVHPTSPQPDAEVKRLSSARFVWIGEDPQAGTPRVVLQRSMNGTFVDVTRRSGRAVTDADLLLIWTPLPGGRKNLVPPRTHYWAVEWQAVTPSGTAGLEDLEDRFGVALGTYRFHVIGTGYELSSDPFTVKPATLVVSAMTAGSTVEIDVNYDGSGGFRLLDLAVPSNGKVPARRGPFDVTLALGGGATQSVTAVMPSAAGRLVVDVPMGATVTGVTVTDRFSNAGSAKL